MKLSRFLYDKLYVCIIFLTFLGLCLLLFAAFKIPLVLTLAITFIATSSCVLALLIDFFRKRHFYNQLFTNISNLDQAYLVLETLTQPNFYEGELLCQALYAINKSMKENINSIATTTTEFREYIEMWVHEVKAPLMTLLLINCRSHSQDSPKIELELLRLESYLDQVLYYTRSENAAKDYLIQKSDLSEIIKNVSIKNLPALVENHIDLIVEPTNFKVMTDAKWLEFILAQILNNSIKYHRKIKHPYIKIQAHQNQIQNQNQSKNQSKCQNQSQDKNQPQFQSQIILEVLDNGIGIPASDLRQVFDKSFTGHNGRKIAHSTGMGLYLAKTMCEKLGHQIKISSTEGKSTKVSIIFSQDNFFDVV